jgi:hypothetical protein
MGFFSSWLRTRKYSLCTHEEKTYIHNQIKNIIAASEHDTLHMKIATKMLVSLKLADETPVTVTVQELVTICTEQGFVTCPFTVSYGQSSVVFSFIHTPVARVAEAAPIATATVSSTPLEVEYDTIILG